MSKGSSFTTLPPRTLKIKIKISLGPTGPMCPDQYFLVFPDVLLFWILWQLCWPFLSSNRTKPFNVLIPSLNSHFFLSSWFIVSDTQAKCCFLQEVCHSFPRHVQLSTFLHGFNAACLSFVQCVTGDLITASLYPTFLAITPSTQ